MLFGSQLLTRGFCLPHQASALSVKSYNLSFHFSFQTSQSSYINHLLVQQTNILLHADYSSSAAAVLLYFCHADQIHRLRRPNGTSSAPLL